MTIYGVPRPRRIVTGPAPARVVELAQTRIVVRVGEPGLYRLAVRYSPYWKSKGACLTSGEDGMLRIAAGRRGAIALHFRVNAGRALAAVVGAAGPGDCAPPS